MKQSSFHIPPGWLFVLLLIYFFSFRIAANGIFNLEMDFWWLLASIVLAALFLWLIISPEPPKPLNAAIRPHADCGEQPIRFVSHGRARLAGFVGAILFTIVGYYVATKARMDPERLDEQLRRANHRVIVAFIIYAWLPYFIFRVNSWWKNRK